ncbi:DUF6355 family natural product biosynthesis protein [Streptomyces canus]|jgi:hypothetical protein|uniref:DUF6355 family natural product biosynthesis protein n=1 Tax=Streptomyces canus TaxID=58343 RepID=UPI002E344654|nr:DUF6355 family natural product biosynthesis protein [Streptomyces canus]
MRARVLFGAATAAIVATALLPGSASASTTGVKACGYYETRTDAYYGHCTNPGPRNWAYIQIDYDWTPFDGWRCVPPGETHLGSTSEIDDAWYYLPCGPS